MWIFSFYRLYCSLATALLFYFFIDRNVFYALLILVALRTAWHFIERYLLSIKTTRDFTKHIGSFKQEFGPYGIRIVNLAESQPRVRQSLAEVFTENIAALRKTVEQLEVMDALFSAGMRPEGDEYLLHDLKLKYGKKRLQL